MSALQLSSTRHATPPRMLALSIVLLALAGMAACYFLLPPEYVVIRTWTSSLLGIAAIWACFAYREGLVPRRLDSAVLVVAGLAITGLLPPIYLCTRVAASTAADPWQVASLYPLVALVTTAGALAFLAGYAVVRRRVPEESESLQPNHAVSAHTMLACLLALAVAVWLARAVLLLNGAYYRAYVDTDFMFGRWYSIAGQVSRYGLVVPILLWLLQPRVHRLRAWAWLASAGELAWTLPSGIRETMLETLFGLLLVVWWRRRRLPVAWLALLLALAIATMPFIGSYRYTIQEYTTVDRVSAGAVADALQGAVERFQRSSDGTALAMADSFVNRLYDGQFLAYLLRDYRDAYEWEYGRTYYTRLPFVFLPYFVFTSRPIMQVPINEWFQVVAGGAAPTTYLGEAYINFGYPGIVVMAFLLGIILGAYDAVLLSRRNDIVVAAVYLLIGSSIPFMVTQSLACWLAFLRNALLMSVAFHIAASLLGQSRHRQHMRPAIAGAVHCTNEQ